MYQREQTAESPKPLQIIITNYNIMASNTPPTNTSPDQPSTPNPHYPFIAPRRIHIMTQTKDEYPLELLTLTIAVTEAEDYSPNIANAPFHQYLDDTFTEQVPSAYISPNKPITNPIVNSPPKDFFRVSSYQLTKHIHLIKCYGTHLFQSNSDSKVIEYRIVMNNKSSE